TVGVSSCWAGGVKAGVSCPYSHSLRGAPVNRILLVHEPALLVGCMGNGLAFATPSSMSQCPPHLNKVRFHWLLHALCGLALTGCLADANFRSVEIDNTPPPGLPVQDFTIATEGQLHAETLFVLDNSGSMTAEL